MRHGFLLVDKPSGPTSHDIVDLVRERLHERAIGHLGTLDPLATGLLVLAVGSKALKVVEVFSHLQKSYEASVRFGAVSTTYDSEGVITVVERKPGQREPDEMMLRAVLTDRFLGKIEPVPPGFSAVNVGGERAYRKMRQGRSVDLPPREVHILSCEVKEFRYPSAVLSVSCSSGTYMRSLAHDLGQLLRSGAYLEALRRTRVGEWSLESAVHPSKAKWADVLPLKDVLVGFPQFNLSLDEWNNLRCGRDIQGTIEKGTIAWYGGLPVALLEIREGKVHGRKVL